MTTLQEKLRDVSKARDAQIETIRELRDSGKLHTTRAALMIEKLKEKAEKEKEDIMSKRSTI